MYFGFILMDRKYPYADRKIRLSYADEKVCIFQEKSDCYIQMIKLKYHGKSNLYIDMIKPIYTGII